MFQLLTHHVDVSASNLYMITAKHTECISTLKKKLDPHLSKSTLFLHAVSGCDTTSRPYGIGKVGVLKKKLDPHLSKSTLFLHAVSGCDTTSRPYGIGKVGVLQKCKALENSTSVSIFFEGRHCKCRRERASGDVWMSDLTTPVSCSTGKVPDEGCYFCRICASREAPAHHRCCRFS